MGSVVTTLALFVLVYGIVFAIGIYYINRLIARGPQGLAIEPPGTGTDGAATGDRTQIFRRDKIINFGSE